MLIEALKPLRLKLRDGSLELHPGVPAELDDESAERLLQKRPDAVRAVPTSLTFEPRTVVRWVSRLFFGEMTGRVLMGPRDGKVLVLHPLTQQSFYLPVSWIIPDKGTSGR